MYGGKDGGLGIKNLEFSLVLRKKSIAIKIFSQVEDGVYSFNESFEDIDSKN